MQPDRLTILCISRFGAHSQPFIARLRSDASDLDASLVIGADGPVPEWLQGDPLPTIVPLSSAGYIEAVLDDALAACPDGYVLRIDDDETISAPMLSWIAGREYEAADHWAFPRMHLWPDVQHYLTNPPLWPDLQTRLSVKAKAGGRPQIHQGSPHGTGRIAEGAPIEHHKFLVRTRAEREALLEHYERLQPGSADDHFASFSVPERFAPLLRVRPLAEPLPV